MYLETLKDRLKERTAEVLQAAGRDKRKIKLGLYGLMEELGDAAGRDNWSYEYKEYLHAEMKEALKELLSESVAAEEYEWAAGIFKLKIMAGEFRR
jgi:hypothetical protein